MYPFGNKIYPSGSQNLLRGNFHFCQYGRQSMQPRSGTYAALLTNNDGGYEYSANHEFYEWGQAPQINYGGGAAGFVATTDSATDVAIVQIDVLEPDISCLTGCLSGTSATFPNVDSGQTIQAIVIFQSGVIPPGPVGDINPPQDWLLAYFDKDQLGANINIAANDGDITINWNGKSPTGAIVCLLGGCAPVIL